jgi:hypothetical protein
MANQTDPDKPSQTWFKWATTPPQSYAVYLILLILVWMVSFYAGTMNPKHGQGIAPPPAANSR